MRKLILTFTMILLFTSVAYAAEAEEIRIAVIDSGISTAAVSPESIAKGQNYIIPDDTTEDKLGHGTAIAAIIVGSESARIVGICPTAQLVPLVYTSLDENGQRVTGETAMTVQAIYDAVDVYGCNIINISSGGNHNVSALKDAVEYAAEKGVLVVSSAGNSGVTAPGLIYYPGAYDVVLCVGACNADGTRADFSQDNDTVDVLALGVDLRIASHRGTRIRGEGTSYAAAVVTATAAQLWTENPGLTANEVCEQLLDSALQIDGHAVLDPERTLNQRPDALPFIDVAEGAWYAGNVRYVYENRLMNGTSSDLFSPSATTTRGMIVTILHRLEGEPDMESEIPDYAFADVEAESWYGEAVYWAQMNGIVKGYSDEEFAPEQQITREQIAAILERYADFKGIDTSTRGNLAKFTDQSQIADWAKENVAWAIGYGLLTGKGNNTLDPQGNATRAEVAAMLQRFLEN